MVTCISLLRSYAWALLRARRGKRVGPAAPGRSPRRKRLLRVALGLDDLLAAIVAAGADVMAQVHFPADGLDGERRVGQEVVGATHAALRRRFLVLLNSHVVSLLKGSIGSLFQRGKPRERGSRA